MKKKSDAKENYSSDRNAFELCRALQSKNMLWKLVVRLKIYVSMFDHEVT